MTIFGPLLADPALAPILAALPQARLVGGSVRDTLAGRPITDIDIANPDPPEQALQALQAAGLRVVPTGIAHGTVTAISLGRPFEITTLRRDTETDGRHAVVAWSPSFAEDAARRDFTINAMSVDQAGELHDYFGGQADLAAGRVRFVGEAKLRVAEDYLRILRFFRFYARYATTAPDQTTSGAIRGGIAGLTILSAERVWSEIKRILSAPQPGQAVARMAELGVLQAVLPEAAGVARLARVLASEAPADPLLRLAALLTHGAEGLATRLRLSTAEAACLVGLTQGSVPAPGASDNALRRALAETPRHWLIGRSWLAGAGPEWAGLRKRLEALPQPIFPLEGRHALQLGATPGPNVGEALRQVRAWWLEGGCQAGEAACLGELTGTLQ